MGTTATVDIGIGKMTLTQDLEGTFERFRDDLDTSRARAADVSPAFRTFQSEWWLNERMIFAAQGIPSWPSLSPAYALRKAQIAPGKPMLRLTDRLFNSLTDQTGDSVYEIGPRTLVMGTTVSYSQYHTEGTRRMPARRHVFLLPDTWQKLAGAVFEFVVQPFRRP